MISSCNHQRLIPRFLWNGELSAFLLRPNSRVDPSDTEGDDGEKLILWKALLQLHEPCTTHVPKSCSIFKMLGGLHSRIYSQSSSHHPFRRGEALDR